MKYQIATTKDNLYISYLRAINGVLGLTDTELLILGEFLFRYKQLPSNASELLKSKVLFSPETRKQIQYKLDLSQANFNNYISSLKAKNAIIDTNDYKEINSNIIPVLEQGKIVISFEFIPQLDPSL